MANYALVWSLLGALWLPDKCTGVGLSGRARWLCLEGNVESWIRGAPPNPAMAQRYARKHAHNLTPFNTCCESRTHFLLSLSL